MPITGIQWWGSYRDWQSNDPPDLSPEAWLITFWSNTPADDHVPFNRPGTRLVQFEVPPDRVKVKWVGYDRFPDQPSDSCFLYQLELEPAEYLWPETYDGDVFWIGITAVYKTGKPDHVWGWKTRPLTWMAGAIEFVSGLSTTPSGPISFITIIPVEKKDACGNTSGADMAFALKTSPDWIKWAELFTGLRDWLGFKDERSTAIGLRASSIAFKWQQLPDEGRTGLAVDATTDIPRSWSSQIIADDFECRLSGPITQIMLWGAYLLDLLPNRDPANIQFTLSIREDRPASGKGISTPGKVLWTKTFKKGQFTVQEATVEKQAFSSPCNNQYIMNDHSRMFKYTFTIDPADAFMQTGSSERPVVYWLSVQASINQVAGSMSRFGWLTSTSIWNDDAVWAQAQEPYSGSWQKLSYPSMHPRVGQHTALAFAVLTSHQSTSQLIDRQVADDWKSEGPMPVVAATWWGSYAGYTYKACECVDQVQPVRPDYFVLSIWSDSPDPNPDNPQDFSHPDQRLWQFEATQYDEVLVGYDGQKVQSGKGQEAVFRYSVRIPPDRWFFPGQATGTYWFSVVAVYENRKVDNHPWGWTNHQHVFNDSAVVGSQDTDPSGKKVLTWQPLTDEANDRQDMSFILFQQAQLLGPPPLP